MKCVVYYEWNGFVNRLFYKTKFKFIAYIKFRKRHSKKDFKILKISKIKER